MSDAPTTPAAAPEADAPLLLACLDRAPAPATLKSDFDALASLSPAAQQHFWDVLGPGLEPTLGADFDRAIEAFARRYDALPSRVALALRGCRFLLVEAARVAADPHAFAADLGRLGGERAEALRAALLPGFEGAMRRLRADLVRRTILDHGALLTAVDWRVDRVLGSQHARAIDAPLGVLTLTFREGAQERRLTLHCEPGMLQRLRSVCEAMLA